MKRIVVSLLVVGFVSIALASCGPPRPSLPRPRLPKRMAEIKQVIIPIQANMPVMEIKSGKAQL